MERKHGELPQIAIGRDALKLFLHAELNTENYEAPNFQAGSFYTVMYRVTLTLAPVAAGEKTAEEMGHGERHEPEQPEYRGCAPGGRGIGLIWYQNGRWRGM